MKTIRLAGKSDQELLYVYTSENSYQAQFTDKQLLTRKFLKQYHQSLFLYKHFYDDLSEMGNPQTATECFYFIPGFNGTPSQIRFGLPSLLRRFGKNVYIKGLYLDEFSCKLPYWEKFTAENLELRRQKIKEDLEELTKRFNKVRVVTSSSGFYDFLGSWPELQKIKSNLILYWISCAPDTVSASPWEKYFYKLNGFTINGQRWFSYPNLQVLKHLNPECGNHKNWHNHEQNNVFFKNDLESRFFCFGFLWDYISTECFNDVLQNNLAKFNQSGHKIDIETHALAATKDGFWDDSSPANIKATLGRYINRARILYKPTSHLWIVTPEHLSDLFK